MLPKIIYTLWPITYGSIWIQKNVLYGSSFLIHWAPTFDPYWRHSMLKCFYHMIVQAFLIKFNLIQNVISDNLIYFWDAYGPYQTVVILVTVRLVEKPSRMSTNIMSTRDRWTRVSAVCPRHVRVRDLEIFHVRVRFRCFKICDVRVHVRRHRWTSMSVSTDLCLRS